MATVVEEYRQGAAVEALAQRHQVAPKTIRRVLDAAGARSLPDELDVPPTDIGEQHRVPASDPDATPRSAGTARRSPACYW
ncbi:transposase-like protein [Nonomuraea thailandensis]|uniref:Transposase-like protein n=1 Tax=Nonomuraea thailandensis TaxID=1188745 RepID=A0A9X2JY28_9ACTN|nr:hypothetical protein [Nonomuraea thailandensis]MCP2353737.1 transposase-like protein [Nonomuraea thailandensis]